LIGIVGSIFDLVLIIWDAANLDGFDRVVMCVPDSGLAQDRLLGMMQIEVPTRRLF
jgi:hypothetical protein